MARSTSASIDLLRLEIIDCELTGGTNRINTIGIHKLEYPQYAVRLHSMHEGGIHPEAVSDHKHYKQLTAPSNRLGFERQP